MSGDIHALTTENLADRVEVFLIVGFGIGDETYSDNVGGISLLITPLGQPPAPVKSPAIHHAVSQRSGKTDLRS